MPTAVQPGSSESRVDVKSVCAVGDVRRSYCATRGRPRRATRVRYGRNALRAKKAAGAYGAVNTKTRLSHTGHGWRRQKQRQCIDCEGRRSKSYLRTSKSIGACVV